MKIIKDAYEFIRAFGFIPFAMLLMFLGAARVSKLFGSTPGERNGDVRGDGSPDPE